MKFKLTFMILVGLGIAFACAPYPKEVQTDPAVKAQRFPAESFDSVIEDHIQGLIKKGRQVFRYDTLGVKPFGETNLGSTKRSPAINRAAWDPDCRRSRPSNWDSKSIWM